MFTKFAVGFILLFSITKNEAYSTPIDMLMPFQVFNGSNVLAQQGFEKYKQQNPAQIREKRFLGSILELLNLFDGYFYTDEDDDSSEKNIDKTQNSNTQHDLCRNCSVIYNKINEVHHVYQTELPVNVHRPNNTTPNQEGVSIIEKLRSASTNEGIKTLTEAFEKPVFPTSSQEVLAQTVSIVTEASSSPSSSSSSNTAVETKKE